MGNKIITATLGVFFVTLIVFGGQAMAEVALHVDPKQLGFSEPVTPQMKEIMRIHDGILMPIITAITIFVTLLLVYVLIRFNRKANPVPSKTTHNTAIEVVWTLVPVLILVGISIPSLRLLYFLDVSPDQTEVRAAHAAGDNSEELFDEITIKAIGYQWYWGYEYPDNGIELFESRMIADDVIAGEASPDDMEAFNEMKASWIVTKDADGNDLPNYRLLETDNRVVLPVNTNVRIQITASDVIHAWTIPQFGVKTDAVPGRLNETWVRIEKPGVYYGQCSELCGKDHAFMPIVVEAVSKEQFNQWVASKGGKPAEQKQVAAN